jgi:hypothetical protein
MLDGSVLLPFETVSRGDQPPEFMFSTMISLFCVEMLFPILFILQWTKIGIFQDYMMGEFGFIVLSFIVKFTLAWTTLEAFVDNWMTTSPAETNIFN